MPCARLRVGVEAGSVDHSRGSGISRTFIAGGSLEPCRPDLRLSRISRLLRGIAQSARRPSLDDITCDVAYFPRSARHITLGDVSHAIALTCLAPSFGPLGYYARPFRPPCGVRPGSLSSFAGLQRVPPEWFSPCVRPDPSPPRQIGGDEPGSAGRSISACGSLGWVGRSDGRPRSPGACQALHLA